ncbi:MAG: S8 family serine peptidase, partial [Pseudomonadota bacterium]
MPSNPKFPHLSILLVIIAAAVSGPVLNTHPSIVSVAWADDGGGDGGDGGDGDGGDGGDGGDDGRDDRDDGDDRDDDDGDDRDDDDNDDRSESSSSRNSPAAQVDRFLRNIERRLFGQNRQRRAPAQAAPQPTRDVQASDEIAVLDLDAADLTVLEAEGYSVIATIDLDSLAREVTRLEVPEGIALAAARDRVRALASGQTADFNHFYRTEQQAFTPEPVALPACEHENCRAWMGIGWPQGSRALGSCSVTVPIGMIDTGINTTHEIIAGADLDVIGIADEALAPSKAIHGTAVASVLVGAEQSRVPGLIREARIVAIDAFGRDGSDERADLLSILRGLDLLAARDVRVINLSLAGPDNRLLRDTVNTLITDNGITIVAAAGNAGPGAKPAFPAGYDNVIAVTAVDIGTRIYRRAQRGQHLDIAAPGVNLLAATSIRGARLKTGTSFAVPYVTATAAVLLSVDPTRTPQDVANWLAANARDLGAEGPD